MNETTETTTVLQLGLRPSEAHDPVEELASITSLEAPGHSNNARSGLRSSFHDISVSTHVNSLQRLACASSQLKFSLAWPLSATQEALLLRHWVENVSGFFDFLDPRRPFAIEVPQRARSNRTLANAVFALSARHLSGTTDFDALIADQYLEGCLRTLIPTLEDSEAVMDDDLLAALVILRMLEEMDLPFVGSDLQSHLFGTQAIIRAQRTDTKSSNLSQATRWCAFRQEIFGSLNSQRAFQLNMMQADIDWAMNANDDAAWACRAVLHCRDAIQFSLGAEGTSSEHTELREDNVKWRINKPTSFEPFYVDIQSSSNGNFPDVRMHMDWHVMASQYNILAHILLTVYDPKFPRSGPSHKQAVREVDRQVQEDVKILCGIGLSNPQTASAMQVACMAISLCGDRFTDDEEQHQLQGILARTEKIHGWPTAAIEQQLKVAWGWGKPT